MVSPQILGTMCVILTTEKGISSESVLAGNATLQKLFYHG